MAMVAGVAGGGTMRSTLITAGKTISRGTVTTIPIVPRPKQGIRTGSITLSTGEARSTGPRERPRSMGSSVRVRWGRRRHQMPGATAVAQEIEAPEELKRATSAVAQAQEAVEELKRATSVVTVGVAEGVAVRAR